MYFRVNQCPESLFWDFPAENAGKLVFLENPEEDLDIDKLRVINSFFRCLSLNVGMKLPRGCVDFLLSLFWDKQSAFFFKESDCSYRSYLKRPLLDSSMSGHYLLGIQGLAYILALYPDIGMELMYSMDASAMQFYSDLIAIGLDQGDPSFRESSLRLEKLIKANYVAASVIVDSMIASHNVVLPGKEFVEEALAAHELSGRYAYMLCKQLALRVVELYKQFTGIKLSAEGSSFQLAMPEFPKSSLSFFDTVCTFAGSRAEEHIEDAIAAVSPYSKFATTRFEETGAFIIGNIRRTVGACFDADAEGTVLKLILLADAGLMSASGTSTVPNANSFSIDQLIKSASGWLDTVDVNRGGLSSYSPLGLMISEINSMGNTLRIYDNWGVSLLERGEEPEFLDLDSFDLDPVEGYSQTSLLSPFLARNLSWFLSASRVCEWIFNNGLSPSEANQREQTSHSLLSEAGVIHAHELPLLTVRFPNDT